MEFDAWLQRSRLDTEITEEVIADPALAEATSADREVAVTSDRMHLRIRLACGDAFAIGPGKADLLEAIEREGSISAAGRALGMSYRRSWLLVDEMNRCFRQTVVETLVGGGRQRGARLSLFGKEMLVSYRALVSQAVAAENSDAYARLTAGIREVPLAIKT